MDVASPLIEHTSPCDLWDISAKSAVRSVLAGRSRRKVEHVTVYRPGTRQEMKEAFMEQKRNPSPMAIIPALGSLRIRESIPPI